MGNQICEGCVYGQQLADTLATAHLETIAELTNAAMDRSDQLDRKVEDLAASQDEFVPLSNRLQAIADATRSGMSRIVESTEENEVVCRGKRFLNRCGAKVVKAAANS